MDRLSAIQNALNTRAQPYTTFLRRPPVIMLLTLFLVAYAGNFVPKLAPQLVPLFDNIPFKIAYLAMVVYVTGVNAGMSVLLGLSAYVVFAHLRGENTVEAFGG